MDVAPVGENFDLTDLPVENPNEIHLMNLGDYFGSNIDSNIQTFDHFFSPLYQKGYLLYHREVCGPIAPTVIVYDHHRKTHQEMLMFGSNNYLGLANDPEVKNRVKAAIEEFGVGMAGPMILNGRGSVQRLLEERMATFKGCEAAMLLPTGYQANLAWVSSLVTDNAILLYDEASHASLIDAIRMGRKKAFRFSNHDLSHLKGLLEKYRNNDPNRDLWICVQGVYSMTGETADLDYISALCEEFRAFLVVDDAHGTGVLGRGKGTAEYFGVSKKLKLNMGTFSKSFAVTGGFLAGDKKLINYIRFFARPYFFSAAMSPMNAAAILAGLDIIENEPGRIHSLHYNCHLMRSLLAKAQIKHHVTESAIIPIYPPRKGIFRQLALDLHNEGLFVNPIEPPAVPLGEERFRVSVMATHSEQNIRDAVSILERIFRRYQQ